MVILALCKVYMYDIGVCIGNMHLVFPWVPFGIKKIIPGPNAEVRFTIPHVLLRLYNTCAAVCGMLLTITVVRELYVVLGIV